LVAGLVSLSLWSAYLAGSNRGGAGMAGPFSSSHRVGRSSVELGPRRPRERRRAGRQAGPPARAASWWSWRGDLDGLEDCVR